MKMKLSIVIPVYGVEKYIADCINSCIDNIGHSSDDVEVIVVDDGSKDSSIDIARNIIGNIPYFRIISQQNQGLSMARNNGLNDAKGEYIWFVDSDDIIAPGIVGQILEVLKQYGGLDMLELKYEMVDEESKCTDFKTIPYNNQVTAVITGKERLLSGFNSPVPFHVFRKAYLNENDLRMYSGIYHEDGEFTPRALWMAKKVAVLPAVAYYYRQRNGSIMHSVNPKNGEDNILVAHRLMDFFDSMGVKGSERRIVNDFISMAYCNGLHSAIGAKGAARERIDNAAFQHRVVLRSLRESTHVKYRVLGSIASFFPRHTVFFYLLMMRLNVK